MMGKVTNNLLSKKHFPKIQFFDLFPLILKG
jgi:hypothetical protein